MAHLATAFCQPLSTYPAWLEPPPARAKPGSERLLFGDFVVTLCVLARDNVTSQVDQASSHKTWTRVSLSLRYASRFQL